MAPSTQLALRRIRETNPEAFCETMAPITKLRVRPVAGSDFLANLTLAPLTNVTLFEVEIPNAHVVQLAPDRFVGLTAPLRGGFRVTEGTETHEFSRDAHFQLPDRCLRLTSSTESKMLVAHFLAPLLQKHRDAYPDEAPTSSDAGSRLERDTRPTNTFLRFLDFVWRELQNGGSFLRSPVATTEIEDALYTLFVEAINAGRPNGKRRSPHVAGPSRLLRASDYIDSKLTEGITVPEIADAAAVSVPTLNRTFRKYYGMGPKSVVKQRRLESVRHELLKRDPEDTTVTRIAVKYGFTHFGQFAADYKRMFLEHPSTTLRKPRRTWNAE
jgi:AraC-like DNA-binding protein